MVESGKMIESASTLADGSEFIEMVPEMVEAEPLSFWKGYQHSTKVPEGVTMPTLTEAWSANEGGSFLGQLGGTLMDIGSPTYDVMKTNQLDKILTNVIGNSPQAQCLAGGGSWDYDTDTCSREG